MRQKLYKKVGVQAAIIGAVIGGIFVVVAALLSRKPADPGGGVRKVEVGDIDASKEGEVVIIVDQSVKKGLATEEVIDIAETIFRKYQEENEILQAKLTDTAADVEELKGKLVSAITRAAEAEKRGDIVRVRSVIDELRETGNVSGLLSFLIEYRSLHREELIDINREIAAVAYLRGDIDVASEAVGEILKLQPDDIVALNQKGHIHLLRGELDEAESDYKRVLELATGVNNKQGEAAALGNLGLIYMDKGELEKAEEMHKRSLEISEKIRRLEGMASEYGNLGNVYYKRDELDRAEEMHKKSLEIAESIGNQGIMASEYGNLGLIYRVRGELEKAEEMFREGLKIDEKLGRLEGIAAKYGNLGLIYLVRGELDKAEQMHRKALEIDERIGRLEGMANQYGNLGNVYYKRDELDRAEEMHKKSLEIAESIGNQGIMASEYANLGGIYKRRGDVKKARDYWEKAVGLYKRIGMPHMVEKVQGWIEGVEGAREK